MIRLAIPRQGLQPLSKIPTLRAGQSYERRASAWMEQSYGMVPQVEFEYHGSHHVGFRFIPDGLLFDDLYRKLVVVEIKSQNSEQAYAQLRKYVVWLSKWFPGSISGLMICAGNPIPLATDFHMAMSPLDAFEQPFALLAIAARSLPRIKDGLGMGRATSHFALRSSGSSRNNSNSYGCHGTVASVARARSA